MPTVTYTVTSANDDGNWSWYATGTQDLDYQASFLRVGRQDFQGGRIYGIILCFRGVSVPQGAIVSSAPIKIEFQSQDIDSGKSLSAIAAAYAQDDAILPTTFSQAFNAQLTASNTSVPDTTGKTGIATLVDVASALNEVFSRPGWQSGNDIVIDIRDTLTDPSNVAYNANIRVEPFDEPDRLIDPTIEITYVPNTAPTISTAPSVDYAGSNTRLGPNATPAVLTFTATDAEQTSVNELRFEIRTAASGGGVTVTSGFCTSGQQTNVNIPFVDPWPAPLVEGTNTLYLRVGDGSLWSADSQFDLLVDFTAPSITGSITHSPNPVTET